MLASALLDLPTGATVVCAFGLCLLGWWGLHTMRRSSIANGKEWVP
jgi:hypothetical protein